MKIKTIIKHEDNSRLINVNFVTSMIENEQVSIGMKYFVIEYFSKSSMGYDVNTALDEGGLVNELCNCTSGMKIYEFKRFIDNLVKETPKFCYVYDNIWKYVLWHKFYFEKTVKDVEKNITDDINAYHNCKLYDLLAKANREDFEEQHPVKVYKPEWSDKIIPTEDYSVLYTILWEWFNILTKGKYELVDEVLYNKAKKADEKLSTLKYKELSKDDLAEVYRFVQSKLGERGLYHNTGELNIVTADGRKLRISDVDTLDLAVGLSENVYMVGDYIAETRFDLSQLFNVYGCNVADIQYETIDNTYRMCLKMMGYDDTKFYDEKHPYGRLGYRPKYGQSIYHITCVNRKSVQLDDEKRRLTTECIDGKDYDRFSYFNDTIVSNGNRFTPEYLMEDTREKAKKYYEDAVKRFGEPVIEQEVDEQELVAAASEAI